MSLEVVLLRKCSTARAGVGTIAAMNFAFVTNKPVGRIEPLLTFVASERTEPGMVLHGVRLKMSRKIERSIAAFERAHKLGRGVRGVFVSRFSAE